MMKRRNMLAIQLPDDISTRLTSMAQKMGKSKEEYVQEAILQHLEEMEEYYAAHQLIDRINQGDEPTYSSDEVRKELGLEN